MRHTRLLPSALLTASLALTGCGGESDSDSPPPVDEPSQSQQSASESSASQPPTPEASESQPPERPSASDLRLALLTLDDVPSGWQDEESRDTGDELCGFALDKLLGTDEESLTQANVVLSADKTSGPKVAEGLGLLPPGRGTDVLAELRAALDDCDGEEVEGIALSVSALRFPTLADDSAAYLLRLGDGDSGWEFPLVYAIHGDLVIGVWTYDFTKGGDPVALLKQYAPLAVDKAIRGLE